MRGVWVLALLSAVGCGKDGKPDNPQPPQTLKPILSTEEELKQLAGEWRIVQFNRERVEKSVAVTFAGDRVTFEGGLTHQFRIDPNKDPKWIDLTHPFGDVPCIYKLDGNSLVLYVITETQSDKPEERPKDFEGNYPGQILHLERTRK